MYRKEGYEDFFGNEFFFCEIRVTETNFFEREFFREFFVSIMVSGYKRRGIYEKRRWTYIMKLKE